MEKEFENWHSVPLWGLLSLSVKQAQEQLPSRVGERVKHDESYVSTYEL